MASRNPPQAQPTGDAALNKPVQSPGYELPKNASITDEIDPFASQIQQSQHTDLIFATDSRETEIKPDTIPPAETTKIVKTLAEKYRTTETCVLAGIAKLVQDGGTNASKKQLKRTVNNIEFDINDIRSTILLHYKSGTVRKLAKTLRYSISTISSHNKWPGPLVKDLLRLEPQLSISPEDAIYCCEIHSDNYNEKVPPTIREALQRREQKIREQNKNQPKTSKGKKKKK